jgi:hypothetical protein
MQNQLSYRKREDVATADGSSVRAIDHQSASDRELVRKILREYFASMPVGEDVETRYRWLYLDNPHGVARTYVALSSENGAPVGITSLFPRAVQVGARVVTGAIGGDAFVTPRFRRRGIVTRLHRLALGGLDDRLSFMFGPPEPNNLKALLQAGARLTGAVGRYRRPFTIAALGRLGVALRPARSVVERLLAPTSPRGLTIEPLGGQPDPRMDSVWHGVSAAIARDGGVSPVRDARFYAWRFGRSPARGARAFLALENDEPIGAFAVWGRNDGPAGILDVTCTPDRLRSILRAGLHTCRGASSVDIQIHVPALRFETTLLSLGFVPRGRKAFQVQSNETCAHRESITRASAWHYMWGDGDVDDVV